MSVIIVVIISNNGGDKRCDEDDKYDDSGVNNAQGMVNVMMVVNTMCDDCIGVACGDGDC